MSGSSVVYGRGGVSGRGKVSGTDRVSWRDGVNGKGRLSDRGGVYGKGRVSGRGRVSSLCFSFTLPLFLISQTTLCRYMFWTDWGKVPKIERANMDGRNRTMVVSSNLGWPNGLSVDHSTARIIWADARIEVCMNFYKIKCLTSNNLANIK